eukprot:gene6379-7033_t
MMAVPLPRLALLCCLIFLSAHATKISLSPARFLAKHLATAITAAALVQPFAAQALEVQYKLPPIDFNDKSRCKLVSSSIGQANAARDKLYDLRLCDLKGQTAASKDLSGMIAADADFSGVSFKEAQISKAYAKHGNFRGVDFSNAVADRVVFEDADLSQAIFVNSVLSGTNFANANLKDTDFTDSYLGPFDLKQLCANPTLQGKNPVTGADSRQSAGCL